MLAPDNIGFHRVTPRHMLMPEYRGSPSSGKNCLRIAELMPSQAIATRPRTLRRLTPPGPSEKLTPTPIGLISAADSNIRQGMPRLCNASPSVNPPMPAPTMMTSSIFPPGALSGDCGDETRLVSLLSILRRADLAAFNEAHAHARGLTCRLTCQPFRAGP